MMRVLRRGAMMPLAGLRFGSSRNKFSGVEDAVYLIPDNSTITVSGFVAQGCPEYLLEALGQRFVSTGSPKNLTLLFGGGPGDFATKGINHLAKPGLLKRTIGSHYGQVPMVGEMALAGAFEAYTLPLGSISRMIRAAASKQIGHITQVGFGTMVDPAFGGGKLNSKTTEDLVEVIDIKGKKYLLYKAIPIDVALIRGTTGDQAGNISMERESLYADAMIQAMAARSQRGVVIAQVQRLCEYGSMNPRIVQIPGTMVDCVVQAPKDKHWMSYFNEHEPAWTGEIFAPFKSEASLAKEFPLDERKVIARRAALELQPNFVLNLGIGMPEGVAMVANEERVLDMVELTTEPGVHGGVGVSGHNFGPAENSHALLAMNQQFDFYNGGGLDMCFLGNAETDPEGNVNVTRVGKKLTGPGGFVDISQSTKVVNMMGTFTAGGLEIALEEGKLKIVKEGKVKKFVKKVKEVTLCGKVAFERGQIINYITERAVFTLMEKGLTLIEVAPGIDLQKQVLDQMEFKPAINEPLGEMDAAIFKPEPMGLRKRNFELNVSQRLSYTQDNNEVFINLSNVSIRQPKDIKDTEKAIGGFIWEKCLKAHREKPSIVVSYDGFDCAPDLMDEWQDMAKRLAANYYGKNVRRYTLRAFSRNQLAKAINIGSKK